MNESQFLDESKKLYIDQVRQLYKQASIGVMTTPIVSLIVVIVLWKLISFWILASWFSAILLISTFRYLLILKFLNTPVPPSQIERYGNWFFWGVALSGIAWGLSGTFFLFFESLTYQIFIGLALCGLIAGASGTYSAILKAFIFFSVPALLPIAISFFLNADKMSYSIGGMAFLFWLMMFSNARRINASIISSLKLRNENLNLIESLKSEKEHAEAILNSIQGGLLIIDKKTHEIIETNPAAAALINVEMEEIVGQVCHRFVCTAEKGACPITDKGQSTDNSERMLLDVNGNRIPILKNVTQVNLNGRECLLESFINITDRKRIEENLAGSLSLMETIQNSVEEGIIVVDLDGKVVISNEKFAQMWRIPPDVLSTREHHKLLEAVTYQLDNPEKLLSKVWKLYGKPEAISRDILKFKDGRSFERFSQPMMMGGRVAGRVWSFLDVTDSKKMEDELRQAKDAAESASRIKSEFLANMSHEIRTPLNTVIGFLNLVLEDISLSTLQRKHLKIAQTSASGLLGLINDILDISKLEHGSLTIENRTFNLRRLMREIHQTVELHAQEKGLKLQLDIDPAISGLVMCDPLRLRQIILNLVSNAIKFTKEGGVSINVKQIEGRDQFQFTIEDTGAGIPKDRLNLIFEPFTQADSSTTRRFGGTGLGTTIARELVKLMGGRIWVESEVGRGSKFHFTINIAMADTALEKDALSFVSEKKALSGFRRDFKVLLVEDIKTNVYLAKALLEKQHHEVTVAWNGREAVEAYQQGQFDVILMDIHMPEMNGIDATKRIRELEADSGMRVPIIAMTAAVTRKESEQYFKAGMNAIVAKPIDFNNLFSAIEAAVPADVRKEE